MGHLKILYTSGYTDSIATLQAIRASSADFIQKPYTPDSLARKVRGVLDANRQPAALGACPV
jgi:FixJ family two-component response regulator